MKIQFKILFGLFLVGAILVSGCAIKEIPPEKYCEKNEDCLTSCGSPKGHGTCFNRDYVESFDLLSPINSPIDGACCKCPIDKGVNECYCQNNVCKDREVR